MAAPRIVRSPRGTQLHCKSWLSEAAYRMIQNNLDPEVAERPQDLVVYGGRGQAARNWECFRCYFRFFAHNWKMTKLSWSNPVNP